MTDPETERALKARRAVINGQRISPNDPWVEFCGWCGQRLDVCKATRRTADCTAAPAKEETWRDRPPLL